jgi:hypothetical protein
MAERRTLFLVVLILALILVAGCDQGPITTPVPAAAGTATPSPSPRPATPTSLPVATATSLPTRTATEPPTAVPMPTLSPSPSQSLPTRAPTQRERDGTPTATPVLSKMGLHTQTFNSPDGKWTARVTVALPMVGGVSIGDNYYTQLKVSRIDGSVTWMVVDEWSNFGAGYTTPRPFHWSKDGRYLYFTNEPVPDGCPVFVNGSDLQQVGLSTGRIREIVPPKASWLSLSPDEKNIAYIHRNGNSLEVILHDLPTAAERAAKLSVIGENVQAGNIVWSPDAQVFVLTAAIRPCTGKWADATSIWADATSIIRVDISTLKQTILIREDKRLFTTEQWSATNHVLLRDADGQSWWMDTVTGQVTVPHTPTPTLLPVATGTPLPTPTATAPPTAVPTPSPAPASAKRATFQAGQVVDVQPGIFFVDITTGAIEGWELPLDAARTNQAKSVIQQVIVPVSPDGRFVLYPSTEGTDTENDRNWKLLDTESGRTCPLPDVRDPGWGDLFSPDGQTFVANTALGIARFRSDCTGSPQSLNLPADEQMGYAVWSPDGNALLVVTERPGADPELGSQVTAYLISQAQNQAQKEPVVVDRGQGQLVRPDWSPDGAHVVVVSPSWGKVQVVDQAGRVLWATTIPATFMGNPRWSPDGRSIGLHADVYTESEGHTRYDSRIYVLDAETGRTRFRLTGASASCGQIWTADSSWFQAWVYSPPYGFHLVAADGSTRRQVDVYLTLPPKDAGRAVVDTWNAGTGLASLQVMDLKVGLRSPLVSVSPPAGLDRLRPTSPWLSDGRLILTTPHAAARVCARDMVLSESPVEFPPFPEVQPVSPPRGK